MKQFLERTKKRKNVCKTHSDGLGMASGNKDTSFHIPCKSTMGRSEVGLPKIKILNPQIHPNGAESRELDVNTKSRVMCYQQVPDPLGKAPPVQFPVKLSDEELLLLLCFLLSQQKKPQQKAPGSAQSSSNGSRLGSGWHLVVSPDASATHCHG